MTKRFEVVGIGNAIVDVLTQCDDDFLDWMGSRRASCSLSTANAAKRFMRR